MQGETRTGVCSVCTVIARSEILSRQVQVKPEDHYYLTCSEGHILCSKCVNQQQADCSQGQGPHRKYQSRIECLHLNRGEQLVERLKKRNLELDEEIRNFEQELGEKRGRYENRMAEIRAINESEGAEGHSRTYINVRPEGPWRDVDFEIYRLEGEAAILKHKIGEEVEDERYFKLFFDVMASLIVLVGVILQATEMADFAKYYSAFKGISIVYFVYLGAYYLAFLKVLIEQTRQHYSNNCFLFSLTLLSMLLSSLIYVPIVVAVSVPFSTFETIRGSREKVFYIPQKFPFPWKINHCMMMIKTGIYWLGLGVKLHSLYTNDFEEVTFVWSFFEAACLVYLNLRFNSNMEILEARRDV